VGIKEATLLFEKKGLHLIDKHESTTFFLRCDFGFSGDFCEISNDTLFNNVSFLLDNNDNQTDLMTYQGIF
jgi:hypothetical protein